jgi:TonB family protein
MCSNQWILALGFASIATGAIAWDQSLPIDPERLKPMWRLADDGAPRGLGLPARASGCAVVAFTIGADGRPRELRVVASHPDARFGAAAEVVIKARRYAPGESNPSHEPVSTFEILSFGQRRPRTGSRITGGIDPAIFAPCDLDAREVAARLTAAAAD